MSTGDPRNPLFTISGLYPPFNAPLMSRAKPFESQAASAASADGSSNGAKEASVQPPKSNDDKEVEAGLNTDIVKEKPEEKLAKLP